MRRQGSGYYDGWYSVPAGHLEAGELPIECVVRETREEIGISIEPRDAAFAHAMFRTKNNETGDRVDLFFTAATWQGEISNKEPHKCDDIRWFPLGALPEKIVPYVREALKYARNGVRYSELNLRRIAALGPEK